VCTIAPVANSGANPSCTPYLCDGANGACPMACTSDADCIATSYCAANGTCQPRKSQAAACNLNVDCKVAGACRECTSNNCVDGFCCDTPCNTLCQACSAALKQSGIMDGSCGPAKDHTNPHGDACPVDPPSSCGHDGKCDGKGLCRLYYSAGVSCGASVCVGTKATGELCDGAGTCQANGAGIECDPFRCTNGGCDTTCVTSADCATDGWCNAAGRCEKKRANAQPCPVKDACTSGFCVDGFCCNAACDGKCEACDVAQGTCTPVTGKPHGARAPCSPGDGMNPCSATQCNSAVRGECVGFVGATVSCGHASCEKGTATSTGTCDTKGGCKIPASVPCGTYACGPTACNTTCTKDSECAPGNLCDVATHACISANASCDGDHTTTGADGTKQDCAPYKCDSNGACKKTCGSVADCVAPTACDLTGHCIAAPPDDTGGCRTSPSSPSSSLSSVLLTLSIALTRARIRRRHRGQRDNLSSETSP
jgi:hypothetical protein